MAHCGDNMGGSFVYSLVVTDVCTGWTEAVPLLAREQSLVVAGLEAIAGQLPFPVLGIDSDNDSVFINDTLTQYCAYRGIEFTRSRAYRKNDQAWVEQKNGAVIRRFLGHERYSGQVAGQTIAHLHGAMRLFVNYFQPSFKLVEKTRHGSAVIKRYSPPATPCDRVIQHEAVSAAVKAKLGERRATLDPVALLHDIREAQSALAAIVPPNSDPLPEAKAGTGFWPGCPTGGWRNRGTLGGNRGCNRRGPGEHGRTRLKERGAMCWAGYRRILTPVQCHCWTGCKLPNRTVSAGRTCEHCNVGCSSGAASWPTSWSTALRMNYYQNCGILANSPWLEQEIRARISVTLPNEAIGIGNDA